MMKSRITSKANKNTIIHNINDINTMESEINIATNILVNFVNGGSAGAVAVGPLLLLLLLSTSLSCLSVDFTHDRFGDDVQLFLFVLKLFFLRQLIGVHPFQCSIQGRLSSRNFFCREFRLDFLIVKAGLQVENIRFQPILSCNPVFLLIVLIFKFLCIGDHLLNFLLRKSSLIVGNSNFFRLSASLLQSRYVEDSVG